MTALDVIRLFIRKVDLIVAEASHDGTDLQYDDDYYYIIIHVTVIATNFVSLLLSFCRSQADLGLRPLAC